MPIKVIRERLSDLSRRCNDLTPLAEPVRKVLWEGNKANKLRGLNPDGVRYAPLAKSTLEQKPRPGNLPFITKGESSEVISGYVVQVSAGPQRLSFTGSYPAVSWIDDQEKAYKTRPARNIRGFRRFDLEEIREMMMGYVVKRGRFARLSSGR